MSDLSKVKIGTLTYNLKDAQARTDLATAQATLTQEIADRKAADLELDGKITAEKNRAEGIEGGLATRIENLEARGRFLSSWNVGTGKPADYPVVPTGASYPYTYEYKSGDYYIVGTVPATGDKYQPSGSSIVKESATKDWTIGTAAETREVGEGDYYVYTKTGWVWIANSQKTVSFQQIAGDPYDNTNLKTALDDKLDADVTVAGVAFAEGDVPKASLQTALELKQLAYKDKADVVAKYNGATITGVTASYTPEGTIALGDFTQTSTAATLTKAPFTPAGTITGSAISGGSINVTVKDATSATSITDLTYDAYTPAGTIAAKATDGSFSALKSAAFQADNDGVQIEGTVSAPTITVTAGTERTFATGLTGGKVATFTEGTFTAASYDAGFLSTGAQASFTQGSKATLTTSSISYVESGVEVAIDDTDTEMLVFTNVTAKSAKAVDTFTANGDDSFTANTLQTLDATKFHGGSKAADTFVANELQDVETGTVHDTPSAALAANPVFTGAKYRVATQSDTALKNVEFTGTAADIKLSGAKYLKQEIDVATFSGTTATLGFAGAEAENVIVTAVNYDKATANGATFTGTAGVANVGNIVVSAADLEIKDKV